VKNQSEITIAVLEKKISGLEEQLAKVSKEFAYEKDKVTQLSLELQNSNVFFNEERVRFRDELREALSEVNEMTSAVEKLNN